MRRNILVYARLPHGMSTKEKDHGCRDRFLNFIPFSTFMRVQKFSLFSVLPQW